MGTRDLVDSPLEWVLDENGDQIDLQKEQEDKESRIAQLAEDRVRNALCLRKDQELSEAHKALAKQYERIIRSESLTPKSRVPEEVMTNGRFSIDTTGRVPRFRE